MTTFLVTFERPKARGKHPRQKTYRIPFCTFAEQAVREATRTAAHEAPDFRFVRVEEVATTLEHAPDTTFRRGRKPRTQPAHAASA